VWDLTEHSLEMGGLVSSSNRIKVENDERIPVGIRKEVEKNMRQNESKDRGGGGGAGDWYKNR
jgi:Thiamin pyrophosphokinase, vitamin B1 binding domain